MEVWGAVINAETQDMAVLGVYSSEEQTLAIAKRVSPDAAEAMSWVLDEIPDWVEGFDPERDD